MTDEEKLRIARGMQAAGASSVEIGRALGINAHLARTLLQADKWCVKPVGARLISSAKASANGAKGGKALAEIRAAAPITLSPVPNPARAKFHAEFRRLNDAAIEAEAKAIRARRRAGA